MNLTSDLARKTHIATVPNLALLFSLLVVAMAVSFYGKVPDYYIATQTPVFLYMNRFLSELGSSDFWLNVTSLGDALILFPLLSLLLLKNTRIWAAFFGALPFASIFSVAGKHFFAVTRPAGILDTSQFTISGHILRGSTSLPSGHTITIFTAAAVIFFILCLEKNIRHCFLKASLVIAGAVIVAFSRVAVGAHWPADLLLGATMGMFSGYCGVFLMYRYNAWWNWMTQSKYQYIHIIILGGLSIAMIKKYHALPIAWISATIVLYVIFRLITTRAHNVEVEKSV